jgi:hypothetical protein
MPNALRVFHTLNGNELQGGSYKTLFNDAGTLISEGGFRKDEFLAILCNHWYKSNARTIHAELVNSENRNGRGKAPDKGAHIPGNGVCLGIRRKRQCSAADGLLTKPSSIIKKDCKRCLKEKKYCSV